MINLSPTLSVCGIAIICGFAVPSEAQEYLGTLQSHNAAITSVSFASDDLTLASASFDGSVKLWDVSLFQETGSFRRHRGAFDVNDVCYAPNTRAYVVATNEGVTFWDAKTFQQCSAIPEKESAATASVALSADGSTLAYTSWKGQVKLWDVASKRVEATFKGPPGFTRWVDLSSKGDTLVAASYDDITHVWDVKTQQLRETITGHAPTFSPDGTTLVTSTGDGKIELWDVETLKRKAMVGTHGGWVQRMSFAGANDVLVTVGQGVKVWNIEKRLALASPSTQSWIQDLAISKHGELLAYGDGEKLELWDLKAGSRKGSLVGNIGTIRTVAFSPDGTSIMASNQATKIWDVNSRRRIKTISPFIGFQGVREVIFSPDGASFATAGGDRLVRVWDRETSEERLLLRGHRDAVCCAAYSEDGTRLASGSYDSTIRVWNTSTGDCSTTLVALDIVRSVVFLPSNAGLASAGADGTVMIWDLSTGDLSRQLKGHSGQIRDLALSHDGRHLASAGDDGTVRVWDHQSGDCLVTRKAHENGALSLAFTPDDKLLAIGSWRTSSIGLWDTEQYELKTTIKAPGNEVTCLAFTHDGTLAASTGENMIGLWKFPARSSNAP